MIYDLITETINNYLGDDYDIKYANNHDTEWKKILPEAQEEMKYGVVQVDSGNTTQVADEIVRLEQARVVIQIPEKREIFDVAVAKIRQMLHDLNEHSVVDSDTSEKATLFFGEYQDAGSAVINGTRWWQVNVVFSVSFTKGFTLASDIAVQIYFNSVWTDITGIISCNYLNETKMDNSVGNNSMTPTIYPNSTQKTLTITALCLTNDTLINYLMSHESNRVLYQIKYNNSIITRTFYAYLAVVNENAVMGDILKVTLTFVQSAS